METTKVAEKIILIEGKFTDEEAHEILTNFLMTKIRFNNIKNLSSQVRFGKDDEVAKKRIIDLTEELNKTKNIIAAAKSSKKKLTIKSVINISLCED
ncbi:MAG: hypothetical protein IPN36_06010 [Bacteroidetes bacterium]|nr:hypothetical protein [Bacteroidota bacterium]